jgi:hypothetical protein
MSTYTKFVTRKEVVDPMTAVVHPIPVEKNGAIKGGFYLKARSIDNSEIAHAAPCTREIWDWILRQCNHKDNEVLGIKRGQCVRGLKDMQEGLYWYVGYRKMTYTKSQCEGACEWLRERNMITTTKTTRGMIITVCNYDRYNRVESYEANNEKATKATRSQQPADTINKNVKNDNSSTPAEWKFSNKGFFDRQLTANEGKPELDKYRKLVEFLHEPDEDGEYKFKNVLSLAKQISFKDYLGLKATEKEYGLRSLKEVLEAMENRQDLSKDYKNVYLTANTWLKNEFKKAK